MSVSRARSCSTRPRCASMSASVGCVFARRPSASSAPMSWDSSSTSRRASRSMVLHAETHAEAELGVVLEQRVRPRRAATVAVRRVRGGRQVAAVDRRTAGRVRDDESIAEQLGEQLDVRGLTASRARSRELEERFEELRVLHRIVRDGGAVELGDRAEEVPALAFRVPMLRCRLHVDRLALDLGLVLGRADVDAHAAPGAVVGRHLHGELVPDDFT